MQYIITSNALTVVRPGQPPLTVLADDPRWAQAVDYVRLDDEEALVDLLLPAKKISEQLQVLNSDVKIDQGVLFFRGQPMPGEMYIVRRILAMLDQDLPVKPLVNFMTRLMDNPSYRAVQELLQFVEYGQMPLTPDGCFLAYKKVREDYKDIYSGSFTNTVGTVVNMPRNQVDEDSERTCSAGLHVCSYQYLPHFGISHGDRVMVVKVDPADVVAVPKDYNNTKMRVCAYTVIDEVENWSEKDVLRDSLVYEEIDVDDDEDPTRFVVEHSNEELWYDAEHGSWVPTLDRATHFCNEDEAIEAGNICGEGSFIVITLDEDDTIISATYYVAD